MKSLIRAASLGALSALLLSGCQTRAEKALCPSANVLASTSALSAFKPGMQGDPSGEIYTIQMTGVQVSCSFDKDEGTTDSSLDITFRASRTPTGDAPQYTVPYYIASVLTGTTILDKQMKATVFSFAPGQATSTFTVNVPSVVNRLVSGHKAYEYGYLVGLQLTREQLDYNKKTGRLSP
jgi:hypothetical protein